MSATTAEALQTINATIEGVNSAPTECPGYINSADLPLCYSWCGPAEHETASFQHLTTVRTWWVRVYVKPLGLGRGVDQGYQECLPFLSRFQQEYTTQEHTDNAAWDCLRYVGDSGVAIRTLHDAPTEELYWTVEFQVQVVEYTSA